MANIKDTVEKLTKKYSNLTLTIAPPNQRYGWGHQELVVNYSYKVPDEEISEELQVVVKSTRMYDAQGSFQIRGMETGCGSMIFQRWTGINYTAGYYRGIGKMHQLITQEKWDNIVVEIFQEVLDLIRIVPSKDKYGGTGPGVLIATAGDGFYASPSYEFITKKLGFRVVDEYTNNQHGADSKQRLLTLHI